MLQNTRKPESENISDLKFKLKLFSIFLISSCFLFVTLLIMPIEVYVPFAFVITIVFSFPIGYAFLEPVKKIAQNTLIVKFSLYTGTGFIICFFWSFFISPFTVHPLAFFLLFIISMIIIFINFYKKIHSAKIKEEDFHKDENLNVQKTNHSWDFHFIGLGKKLILNTNEVILIVIIVVAAIYTANEINDWPPFGDINKHSLWTSMQIFQGYLISHPPLFPDVPLTYPLGIHLFAANLSTLYEINPPQIFFMLGGVGIFFIFTSILSITYVLTKSAWISLIVVASMLHIHSSNAIAMDLLYTLNGLIPNLISIFVMFLLILFLITIRNNVNVKNFLLLFFLILTGIIIYPSLLVYSIILVIAFFITNYQLLKLKRRPSINLDYSFKTKIKRITQSLHLYLFIIIIIGISSGTLLEIPSNFYHVAIEQKSMADVSPGTGYFVTSEIYTDEFFIASTIVGIICSIFVIMYQKRERFLGIFVLLFILITIAGDYYLGFSKIILSPGRFVQMEPILSWILVGFVIGVFLNRSSSISKNSTKIKNHRKPLENRSKTLLKYGVILMFAVLTISLIPNLRGENYAPESVRADFHYWLDLSLYSFEKNEGKYGYMEPYMPGLNWIKNNVTPDELILDFWWTSDDRYHVTHFQSPYKWLEGISYQHYLNDKYSRNVFLTTEQTADLNSSFKNYGNGFELWVTLKYYDISFILTRPDNIRDNILEQYIFLESVYADDFTRIYQIIDENILNEYFFSLLKEAKNKQDIGDIEGAVKIYAKLLSVEKYLPKSFPTATTLLTDLFRSHVTNLFRLYVTESDDYESGLKILKLFKENYKSYYDKTVYDELKPVALKLAKYFEDKHEMGKAIIVYDTLLDFDRFDYESLINKGRLHEIRGEYSLALHAYEQANPLNPNDEIQFKISNLFAKIRTK